MVHPKFPRLSRLLLPILMLPIVWEARLLPFQLTSNPSDPVTMAWDAVRAAGSYHFTSDVTQVTLPTATLSNVGRASRTEKIYLEGQNDLRAQQMEMTLWTDSGSALNAASGINIRSEGGKTLARRAGGEWQEIDDVTGSIAPQGDFLSYLAAIKDVQTQPAERRNGIDFTRYTFTIDSPRFAEYMHQQMETALRARGELPPNVELGISAYFLDMVGSGELWVDKEGLPLRQTLTLQFPAQNDEQVHTQIVVDFSKFSSAGTNTATQSEIKPTSLFAYFTSTSYASLFANRLAPTLLIATLFAFVVLLIYSRRTRPMQMAVIALIIVTQVVGPVLNSYTSANYFEAQAAKAATAKDNQAEAQSDRAMREKLGKVAFNPRLSPLNSGKQSPEITSASFATGLQAPASSLHAAPASQAMTSDTGLDTDGDGLTDFVEERIGTSSVISDTDSDGLNDKIEVNGFLFGGQRWYTNPEVADSNGDGLGDALEWGLNADGSLRTTLLDSDGDGFPDLFDLDNDGDGVPDNKDLSPFAKGGAAYSEATPLQLIVNNLTAGKPTFVEFQIRPQDEKQLWFAYNVLDWPQDSAGQMRDVDGKTYADVAANSRLTPVASETNGDMKAVPMLEIRMPAASANLPPQEELTPFNISINNLSADGQTKVAYVPLSIVTDEKTGQRVAFSGQMRYLPTGSWLSAHQVRLAWVVQALVDMPCDPADSAQVAQGCQADGYIHNVAQPIHTYYGNWSLTGLAVREDHGASMALVYEDPAVDDKPKSDDALWALSFVLDHHFVLGRDDNGDGRRDLTLDDMATRFDRDNNPSEAQRMDVPNILQVEKQSYPTLNQAVAFTAMTETVKILNNVFKPLVTADRTRKPLLLFAQENTMRALTLDAVGSGGYVVQNGGALTLDLAPANQPAQTASVTAGLKWMAYCAPATGDVTFQPCAPDQYWDELDTRYASLPLEAGETDPLLGFGRLMMAQLYYMGFSTGYQGTVQDGQRILSGVYSLQGEDTTATSVRASLRSLAAVPLLADRSFGRLLSVYRISNSSSLG